MFVVDVIVCCRWKWKRKKRKTDPYINLNPKLKMIKWQLPFSVDLVPPLVSVVAAAAAAVPDHFVNNWNLSVSHDSYYLN